jgi:iron complex outermembrane receptor protein
MTQLGLRHSTVEMDAANVQGYNNTTMGMMGYATAANAFTALNHKKTDHNLDATALARLTPNNSLIFEAGYSIKNRSPNLYERYVWGNTNTMIFNMNNWVGDGNGYVGNINLKPETAHTLSLMGEWHDANHEKWNLRVSPHYSYVQDYIDAVFLATRADGFVNLSLANQSAHLYGADVSGSMHWGGVENFGTFKASGVLSYVDGRNETTQGNLYNIMPLNAKVSLEQKLGEWTNIVEVKLVSQKDDVQAVRKELRTPGYGLLNLYSSYQWKQARFDIGIENVFDKLYYHPLGGAYVGQGATMGTGIPYGTSVPSMGRSINVGLTINF